jgi:hypothetical protein
LNIYNVCIEVFDMSASPLQLRIQFVARTFITVVIGTIYAPFTALFGSVFAFGLDNDRRSDGVD